MNAAFGSFLKGALVREPSRTRGNADLGDGLEAPVVFWLVPGLDEQVRAVDQRVIQARLSCFQDCYGDVWVLTETSSKHQARCSTTTDDIVIGFLRELFGGHDGGWFENNFKNGCLVFVVF